MMLVVTFSSHGISSSSSLKSIQFPQQGTVMNGNSYMAQSSLE
jgi:hypothetical protein